MFGVGFAPRDGEALTRHLRSRRFTDEESVAAGLVAHGRSHYDRFRGRLVWPIREANGDTIGFGARRIFDDDRIEAKYLNTSETAIYKKSQVLYGIDLARTAMKDSQQAVVVEGYTDVMACHLAGVRTAVASCGTAFGTEHARVLRRFLGDHASTSGEVIFTFDGDSAGQKAAMKVLDERPGVRLADLRRRRARGHGPLRPADQGGRRGGARAGRQAPAALPLRARQHPHPLRPRPRRRPHRRPARRGRTGRRASATRPRSTRSPASSPTWSASTSTRCAAEVRRAANRPAAAAKDERRTVRGGDAPQAPAEPARPALPSLSDPRFLIERETAQARHPAPRRGGPHDRPRDRRRLHPPDLPGRLARRSPRPAGPSRGVDDAGWANQGAGRGRPTQPSSRPSPSSGSSRSAARTAPTPTFAVAYVYRLQELTTSRRIADVKARLQRTNPVDHALDYNRMFGELVMLEQHRRKLREGAVGQSGGQSMMPVSWRTSLVPSVDGAARGEGAGV